MPSIDFVYTPTLYQEWYYSGTYQILYAASAAVKTVWLYLCTSYTTVGTILCPVLPFATSANTGSYTWTISKVPRLL